MSREDDIKGLIRSRDQLGEIVKQRDEEIRALQERVDGLEAMLPVSVVTAHDDNHKLLAANKALQARVEELEADLKEAEGNIKDELEGGSKR